MQRGDQVIFASIFTKWLVIHLPNPSVNFEVDGTLLLSESLTYLNYCEFIWFYATSISIALVTGQWRLQILLLSIHSYLNHVPKRDGVIFWPYALLAFPSEMLRKKLDYKRAGIVYYTEPAILKITLCSLTPLAEAFTKTIWNLWKPFIGPGLINRLIE